MAETETGGPHEPVPSASPEVAIEVLMDPFTPRLAFVDRVFRPQVRTWFDRSTIRPLEPLDSGAEGIVDFEALEALMDFQGLVRRPKPMAEDAYPTEVEAAMAHREPQFILRNLGRVERHADPDERLELERRPIPLGAALDAFDSAASERHEPPELLDETSLGYVRGELGWRRQIFREMAWNRHFSKEIKSKHTGPMWAYDPDKAQAQASEGAGEAGAPEAGEGEAPPPDLIGALDGSPAAPGRPPET